MEKTERRKEHERTEGTDNNRFSNSRLNKNRKRGKKQSDVQQLSARSTNKICAGTGDIDREIPETHKCE